MGRKWKALRFPLLGLLLLGILLGLIVPWLAEVNRSIYMDAVVRLKGGSRLSSGFWVGDVTELYRMGVISKEVAEADTAPLKPLIDRPRPYKGYYVRAMLSAPSLAPGSDWNVESTSLKGQTVNQETYAFCIYPAEAGRPDLRIYITCPVGIFSKPSEGNQPQLEWPKGEWRRVWAIVD
jgi:hypothetical protein